MCNDLLGEAFLLEPILLDKYVLILFFRHAHLPNTCIKQQEGIWVCHKNVSEHFRSALTAIVVW